MDSAKRIAIYQAISQLTGSMADAARVGDLDELTRLEQLCSALVVQLKTAPAVTLDPETQRQKVELIRKILADDGEIRAHTEPWMASLQKLLGQARQERDVRHAYNLDRP
jgi:flagellar protein FliT